MVELPGRLSLSLLFITFRFLLQPCGVQGVITDDCCSFMFRLVACHEFPPQLQSLTEEDSAVFLKVTCHRSRVSRSRMGALQHFWNQLNALCPGPNPQDKGTRGKWPKPAML